MKISIEQLCKNYQSKSVLNNITTSFKHNQIQGIVGENGAGKTTLFHCLTKLTNYTGEIHFHNTFKPKSIIGFLPAELYFYPRITGKEYIEFCLQARNQKLRDLKTWNSIFELPLNEYAEDYSTGMKKKLAILAILLQNNELFVLDEPFNGVDLVSNLTFTSILQKLKAQGKTIILSSHILASLTAVCDSIYHLKDGIIKAIYQKENFNLIEQTILEDTLDSKRNFLNDLF